MEVKTAPDLLEALIEEEIGIDDIDEGAELSRAEEGLLIEQNRASRGGGRRIESVRRRSIVDGFDLIFNNTVIEKKNTTYAF